MRCSAKDTARSVRPSRFVFGPVLSRRLGYSLGVDVIPVKVCSLNCVYCEVGRTTQLTLERKEYVPAGEVVAEVMSEVQRAGQIDHISFSGSGEPTLNSQLGWMIRSLKNQVSIPVAVLTNGTLLFQKDVREDLNAADVVLPSLDAASPDVFHMVDRPHGRLEIGRIIEGLIQFREEYAGQIWLEILLVKGMNDMPGEIALLRQTIERIRPDKVQLNTVVRPPAEAAVRPLGAAELAAICQQFGPRCEVIASSRGFGSLTEPQDVEAQIVALVSRRPMTIDEICDSIHQPANLVEPVVRSLVHAAVLEIRFFGGKPFYARPAVSGY
jgi:wyosine [tRNA(Phe)-imidazoG37] synthetase (radical SAM superfamily)